MDADAADAADADFSREVVEVADVASSSDLYHWCAMVWGSIGSSAWA